MKEKLHFCVLANYCIFCMYIKKNTPVQIMAIPIIA